MNKRDLVAALAEKNQTSKKDAESALNALIEVITETVASGEKIQLVGFGTFEPRTRAARQVTNPQTGERFMAEESVVPAFKAGQSFKKLVAGAAAARAAATKKSKGK